MTKRISPHEWGKIFKVLGNVNRVNILRLLVKTKELPVKSISERLHLGVKITSQHLVILSHAGMVQGIGKLGSVYYSLHPEILPEVRTILEKFVGK